MNKKVIGFLLAIPAFMGFGLTSCSDEESIAVKETAQDKLVEVTVKASLSDLTRASLTPDKNIIKFEWDMNDVVTVVNADNGKYLGTLKVSKIQESDHRVCEFKGSAAIPAGKVKLNFFYLGTAGVASFGDGLTVNDYSVDFSNQDGTAKFAENDILISTGEFVNVQDGNLGMINFGRDFAYGRFILKYNGEEIDLNGKTVTICANTGKLYNKATLNFQSASYTYDEGAIAVSPETNDFYVSFPATKEVNLKFVVNEFDGTKGESLVADTYYTANTNGDPIVVEMRHSDGTDDKHTFKLTYAANYDEAPEATKSFTWNAVSPYAYVVKDYDLFTREGYVLTSWNTQADGNGVAYAAGSNYIVTYPDHVDGILYAQWEQSVFDYTLIFEDGAGNTLGSKAINGAKEETVTIDEYDDEAAAKLPADKLFKGWALKEASDNVVTTVKFDDSHVAITVVPVYDKYQWIVKFVDELDGTVYQTTCPSSEEPTLVYNKVFPTTPTKEGYKFLGWKYNGKFVADYPKDKLPVLTKDNLEPIIYATWEKLPDPNTVTTPGYGHGTFN